MKADKIMFRIFPLAFLIMASALSSPALADSLSGRVSNVETNRPLEGVNIRIIETENVTASDHQGRFLFRKLEAGTYHLLATHVGYDASDTLRVVVDETGEVEIRLSPEPWVLDDVVVTGTRSPHLLKEVPVQTEVVTRRDFQRTGATTVDEALQSAIGININEDLSGSTATLRGVDKDRVLILVDGERAVGRVNGAIDLGQFALNNVEKIEVVKGTGSTLYGSEAMGGVINIITERPKRQQKKAGFSFDYGTHKTTTSTFDATYGKSDWALNLDGRYYHTDGFDLKEETPHTNGVENIDRWNLNGKFTTRLSPKWNFTGSYRYSRETKVWIESEIWPGFELVYDDDETNQRNDISANFDYLSGDKYSMKLRLYETRYDHQWNKIDRETGTWVDTSDTKDIFREIAYSSNYVIGENHVATYGFDYNYQHLRSTELIDSRKSDYARDAYFQYEYSPFESLNLLSGIRYEHHSSFGEHLNPSLNIMYSPSERIKLRGFVGKGFRAPSIKQLYFIFDHSSAGYIVFGGLVPLPDDLEGVEGGHTFKDLTEENSINSSISAELSYGTVGLHRITYFYNHLDDLIDFVMVGSSGTYWRGIYVYQNIERASTQGIEWESRVRLFKSLDLSFSYNLLESKNLTTGDELVNRPRDTYKYFVTWFDDNLHLGASFWGDYKSSKLWVPRTNTGGNEGPAEYAPERSTLNANIFYRFRNGLEIFVRGQNLYDEVNIQYGYWPGRTIYVGARYGLNTNN